MEMNFNDRESYLAFRREWKDTYLALSAEIRETKNYIVSEMKAGNYRNYSAAQYKLVGLQEDARTMMETVEAAKVEANRQWLESHKQAA